MSRRVIKFWSVLLSILTIATGCHPLQPHYFFEDGDLSHYLDVATQIEHPDVHEAPLEEAAAAKEPLTLDNFESAERWYLTLEEVLQHTLANSQVMRTAGGRVVQPQRPFTSTIGEKAPATLTRFIGGARGRPVTTYDPALIESGNGFGNESAFQGVGVEAALAEFDATLFGTWEGRRLHRANNAPPGNPAVNTFTNEEQSDFVLGLRKNSATGGTFELRQDTNFRRNRNPVLPTTQALRQFYTADLVASFSHPLLQGAGAQYNRVAGFFGFNEFAARNQTTYDGVVIARIRHDISLAEFEAELQDLTQEVETAYWDLYFAFREFEVRREAFERVAEIWPQIKQGRIREVSGFELDQASSQYFLFRSELETALANLLGCETRLRYLMGISPSDYRLIVPADEPTSAAVHFDWHLILPEALTRRPAVRKQKWLIKRRELELIAARNHLLPRLDVNGSYRFNGSGEDLISSNRSGLQPFQPGSNAFENLTGGELQEWTLGLQLDVPIGFRSALSGVRHQELLLARERALLDDLELEISHQLGDAIRILKSQYLVTRTNLNRRRWAVRETEGIALARERGRPIEFNTLLGAQRREVDAKINYYRSLVDYNLAIMRIHYRKGSLLEYNKVFLAEGPWPKKAYFDALREARKRDSAMFLDYGFTRPKVVSRGPVPQHTGGADLMLPHGAEGYLPQEPQGEPVPAEPTPAEDEQPAEDFPNADQAAVSPSTGIAPQEEQAGPQLLIPGTASRTRPAASYVEEKPARTSSSQDDWIRSRQSPPTGRSARSAEFRARRTEQQHHESFSHQPASESFQPAAVWQGVQR